MTRAVTDILYRTDGSPWASAPVTFERTAGSFDDGSSWPPDEKQVTTDATGAYSVQLWPDAAGSIRSRYHVTYPNGDVFYVSIPDGTTPITMPEIRVAAVAPPVPPSALDAHVAAPDPHAGYLLDAEADLRYAALVHNQAWTTISGTPATLGGYGITDAYTTAQVDTLLALKADRGTTLAGYGITDAYTKGQVDTALGGKANAATTLAGYGITDAYTKTAGDARYAPIAHNQAWSTITTTPTTLGGYGITDAYTQTQSNANLALKANLSGGNALTGAQVMTSDATGTKPLIVKGFLGQTANLHEWQDSTGALVGNVTSAGAIFSRNPAVLTTYAWMQNDGLYVTSNTGASINTITMSSGLEMWLKSRQAIRLYQNNVEALAVTSSQVTVTATTFTYANSGATGGFSSTGPNIIGTSSLAVLALDNRFTVTIKQNADQSGTADVFRVQTQAAVTTLATDVAGRHTLTPSAAGNTPLTVKGFASQSADLQAWQDSTGAVLSRIDKNGYFMTRKNTAPADADVVTTGLAIWFDSTTGAAKVMFKGKNAAGTVVTGQVALT